MLTADERTERSDLSRAEVLEGQVALVTGGGSGIGRAVVEAFAASEMKVCMLERSEGKAEELNGLGDSVYAVRGDATSLEDNERALAAALGEFGRLDALVCCVGPWDNLVKMRKLPKEKLHAAFEEIFSTNVESYVIATKVCLEALVESEGTIVYTLSNSAFYPDGGRPLYMASKFAVRGLLTQMTYELAPKVRVNGVAPGGTATGIAGLSSLEQEPMLESPRIQEGLKSINPLQHDLAPADHVGAYLYLADKTMSGGVTGVIINSDGGLGVRGFSKPGGLI
jgi:2,3-dihydroxy-2,3-dihydrophenylpropionate dehydrogenase